MKTEHQIKKEKLKKIRRRLKIDANQRKHLLDSIVGEKPNQSYYFEEDFYN